MINFFSTIVIQEVENQDLPIPLHRFDFVDFEKIEDRCERNYVLTDVIGLIIGGSGIEKDGTANKMVVELQDLRYGDLKHKMKMIDVGANSIDKKAIDEKKKNIEKILKEALLIGDEV
ncbi:hypothetical protein PTKIN_Ptkin12aG0078200 [Pterospermum kingtungense]